MIKYKVQSTKYKFQGTKYLVHKAPYLVLCTLYFALQLLTSCGSGSDEFRLRGEISGMEQSDLLIYNLYGDDQRIDTIHVNEGRFAYAGHQYEPTPYILVFPNAVEQVIFASARASLEYEATASDLRGYKVKGTKENELLNQFRSEIHDANPIETRDIAERYIRRNAASPVALYLFERYFVQDLEADATRAIDLCTLLEGHNPTNALLLATHKALKDQQDEQAKTTIDVPDSLLTASHTLLYFWATWQATSWTNMGELRKAVRVYPRQQLNTVTISVDVTDVNWKTFVQENDSSTIRHHYDGLSWDTPLARQLSITRLPTYILIDRQRNVLFRINQPSQLAAELSKALK